MFYTQRELKSEKMSAMQSFNLCFSTNIRTAAMKITKQTRKQRQMGLTERHLFHKSWNWLAGISPAAVEVSRVCVVTVVGTSVPFAVSCLTHMEITASPYSTVTSHCANTVQLASLADQGPRPAAVSLLPTDHPIPTVGDTKVSGGAVQ